MGIQEKQLGWLFLELLIIVMVLAALAVVAIPHVKQMIGKEDARPAEEAYIDNGQDMIIMPPNLSWMLKTVGPPVAGVQFMAKAGIRGG